MKSDRGETVEHKIVRSLFDLAVPRRQGSRITGRFLWPTVTYLSQFHCRISISEKNIANEVIT